MGTSISFKRPDGKEASGYLANADRGNAPGIVVIQEWWGLQEQIKGLCDRFALAGFDALAPDLYNGKVVPYHDTDAAGKEMNSLDFMDATTQTVRGAVQYLAKNGAKVGLIWLFLVYLIHTMSELCLSPVGLSSMTKLAPTRIVSLMMGVWFLGASVGNFLGGKAASFYESMSIATLLGAVAAVPIVAGIVMLAFRKTLTRMSESK